MRFIVVLLFLSLFAKAQIDSALSVPLVSIHVGGQLPFADLASRFGPNLNIGLSFSYKTKKNWLYGMESNYMFSRNVKEDVLKQLKNSEGYVVDNEGYPADVRVTERGWGLHAYVGKILHLASANPNSGLMLDLGAGYFQSRINIYDAQQKIAAVKGNLRYGYDRLSLGFSCTQFIGYMFLSDNKMLNFYGGIECYESFTKNIRKVNYDTGMPDNTRRLDIVSGIRLGGILPLYKRKPNEFYYN